MIIYEKSYDFKIKNINERSNKIYFITQFFIHKSVNRNDELKLCLIKNLQNVNLDKIILLNETIYSDNELGIDKLQDNEKNKLIQININKRLEYSDIFEFVEIKNLQGFIVFANSDIYVDDSIFILHNSYLETEKLMISLLRFEDTNTIFGPRFDSNDTWIFHSNNNIEKSKRNGFKFYFGKPGCDNKYNYLVKVLGFNIINCPRYIKTYHCHKTNIRDYNNNDRVDSPFLCVEQLDYSTLLLNNTYYNSIILNSNYLEKYNFNDNNKFRDYLIDKINKNNNFLIPRISSVENNIALIGYNLQNGIINDNIIKIIDEIVPIMKNNAGIKITDVNSLIKYSNLYLEAFENCDMYANWEPHGNYIKYIQESHDFIMSKYIKNTIWWCIFDIYHHIYSNPWTLALKGKRILLITSFVDSIKEVIDIREKIYGIDLFPECKFLFLKPPITNGSNESKEFIDELNDLNKQIENIIDDFDVALISCGGYGNLVCNSIYKLNKSAIYVGGVLQMYFGIYGDRWIKERKSILDLYINEYWRRPKENERPINYKNIEGGCYW